MSRQAEHFSVVDVAQLVEPRIVIPVVVGSSPISHPIYFGDIQLSPVLRENLEQNIVGE